MRKKIKKIVLLLTMVTTLSISMMAGAKTLSKSFSGGSICAWDIEEFPFTKYKCYEMAYAKTQNYTEGKAYYLRAYVGGTSNSASTAKVDSGRKAFESGDHTVYSPKYYFATFATEDDARHFGYNSGETSYAKYGYQ